MGGQVVWNNVIHGPSDPFTDFGLTAMAGGPLGHVVVSTNEAASNTSCQAIAAVFDPSGNGGGGPVVFAGPTTSNAVIAPLVFDRMDGLLYGYVTGEGGALGMSTSGFVAGPASKSASASNTFPQNGFSVDALGRDVAGDSFVWVSVLGSIDFGKGPVSGSVVLQYDPSGTLVSNIPAPPGRLTVGALGHLFFTSSVTGTVDYGCGTVGTAQGASTVLTKFDQAGACLWSKALPASMVFALDPMENVLLATTFSGSIDLGGGPLTSVGTSDLALASLDPSGAFVWGKSFGAAGASVSGVSSLGAVNTGGAALSVGLNGTIDFGCGPVSSSAGSTTLIATFDATGAVVYSRVVTLLSGVGTRAAADGLGGVSFAVQMAPVEAGDIVVSRFAP